MLLGGCGGGVGGWVPIFYTVHIQYIHIVHAILVYVLFSVYCTLEWSDIFAIFKKLHVSADQIDF